MTKNKSTHKKPEAKKPTTKKPTGKPKKVLFSDALVAMEMKGKRVTRSSWPEGKELFFDEGKFYMKDDQFDRKLLEGFSFNLIMATDLKIL